MGFDQSTRNRLARFVSDTRRILTDEFTRQCQQDYGIDPRSGAIAELGKLAHLNDAQRSTARILRETIEHYIATSPAGGTQAAVERLVREQAFTVLNRLAALRMAEARGIIIESVSKGYQSKGFQLYSRLAGSSLGETGSAYACYLFSTFDDLALDLAVLFDRFSPQGRLFPNEAALSNVLAQLNSTDLDLLWVEDETIGWLYQYFNSQEERKKMREESSAPRNSRELAVRNQFFTPRYVVEFLTDNTLGRIWYEMTQGDSTLKEQCRYLVRRPTEIFLKTGEAAPEQPKQDNLSQEDLLKQPVFIPHRPLKDPRTILMLDPACGSMHFGLYAFDLFEVIYDEAWALEEKLGADALSRSLGMKSLHSTYTSKNAFLKDVPRLIIEHNLHGIDIDPRCAQIAGLSLWLRAQKAWQRLGLKPAERPAIKRSNIVCAEPMPGEKELLREFVEREFPAEERPVCLRLLEAIFDKMQLAGEAGSLLKIEEEIRSAIEDARDAWQKLATKPPELFTTTELNQLSTAPELTGLEQAVSSLTTDPRRLTTDFWERIEERIYAALRDYAEQAENGGGFQRRLFAEDAARGFAFIDVCRKRYDVALMNPPFGEAGLPSRDYLYNKYSHATQDVFSAFVDRGLNLLEKEGAVGAITSRLAFYLELLEDWRVRLFGGQAQLSVMADLGYGVLDAALVEAAAYVVSNTIRHQSAAAFVSLLAQEDKGGALLQNCVSIREGAPSSACFTVDPRSFIPVPASRAAYWVSQFWREMFKSKRKVENVYGFPFVGLQTGDDEFFLRLAWEVAPQEIGGNEAHWVSFAKGGEYALFFGDFHLLVNWSCRALARRQSNSGGYFKPGITYTERTTSNLSARILPPDCVFSPNGVTIVANHSDILECAALLNSRASQLMIELCVGGGDAVYSGSAARHYGPRIVGSIPAPRLTDEQTRAVSSATLRIWRCFQGKDAVEEPGRYFVSPFFGGTVSLESIAVLAEKQQRLWEDQVAEIINQHHITERIFAVACGIEGTLMDELTRETGIHPNVLAEGSPPLSDDFKSAFLTGVEVLIDEAVQESGASRSLTKKTFIADRKLELLAHRFGIHPKVVIECRRNIQLLSDDQIRLCAEETVSFLFGVTFGRWDIRYATGEQAAPELPDPFAPLPVCPPGQLQNAQGLPARPEDVPAAYPVRIPWDGILVDDPNHPLDIERRVREVIEIIWSGQEGGPTAEAIEHEACEILGVKSLRDYFRKPAGFFADHLKRYSKSRRQAPIYWPLSTASGSYTLWLYYHRLTDQTLFTAVNDFIDPRLKQTSLDSSRLRAKANRSAADNTALEELIDLEAELKELRDELLRIAAFWKPNLNDGVLITAAPLWRLFKLKPWQKKLKETWEELEAGDYDWAHMALTIAPDRVRLKCKTDKSIAIAHGLEDLYVDLVGAVAKRKPRKTKVSEPMLGDEID